MSNMRAKMAVTGVEKHGENSETLNFTAVSKSEGYGDDGLDENNTFATWTPTANLSMAITNPALCGKFEVGQEYYLDFTRADGQED